MDWLIQNRIELISSLSGLASIWLNTRLSVWGWPIGIFSVILAAAVYFENRLYAEFGLQIFYAGSGFYGWILWSKGYAAPSSDVSKINRGTLLSGICMAAAIGLFLGWYLEHFTPADFPYPDSVIAGFSLVGQIWLARKYLENWILWMLVNVASILLYIQKELWFFSCLYLVLLVLAVKGYLDWKKKLENSTAC
jgi:nicotinamide mononucleotide transporter